ncbi:hypothetical protein [Arthronema virus TR020]|uniref:Uncharacterized protein n=1 Tax=Arthronema virus TR020 TaxID=2736280 RepID=A0A7G3WH38_9CAUD|nr:hypothetical protein [Arthronema virus TR020]
MCVYENSGSFSVAEHVKVTFEVDSHYVSAASSEATVKLGSIKRIVVFGRSVDLPSLFTALEDSLVRARYGSEFTSAFDFDEIRKISVEIHRESEGLGDVTGYEPASQTFYGYMLYNSSETLFGGKS